jgi:hypothetical protein
VKFIFTNRSLVPKGIPFRNAQPTEVRDNAHAAAAIAAGAPALAAEGRHREGRVDTGTPVWRNEHHTSVMWNAPQGSLRTAGYKLKDAFVIQRDGKYTVTLVFDKAAKADNLKPESVPGVRTLFSKAWISHVWDNRDTLTVNLVHVSDNRPRALYRTRGEELVLE